MKLAVVTGATGFTGPFVVQALRETFPELAIRCVVRPTSDTGRLAPFRVEVATFDLRDPALVDAFTGADTLVNVASLGFDWTDNVIAAAQRAGLRRAVFISTTAILTRLTVASKPVRERGERLVMASGLDWTILRPTMIYGTPGDRNIVRLIKFVERWPVVPVIAPNALQQPVHVADVAAAVAGALAHPVTIGRVYNLSGAAPLPLASIVRTVSGALGRSRLLVPVPLWPIKAVLTAWAVVARPPVSVEQVNRIEEDKSFDHAEAARDFGFRPRSFADGVGQEIALLQGRRG
jgi:nucleoside-diphosphate-sugar epimerase